MVPGQCENRVSDVTFMRERDNLAELVCRVVILSCPLRTAGTLTVPRQTQDASESRRSKDDTSMTA